MSRRRVVVTGIGLIGPAGATTRHFWQNCLNSSTCARPVPEQWLAYATYASQIWAPLPEISFSEYGFTKTDLLQLDMVELLALAGSFQALRSAQISPQLRDSKKNIYVLSELDSSRTAVVIGTGAGGITSLITSQASHFMVPKHQSTSPYRFNPFVVSMMMPNSCSSTIGIRFSLTGMNTTVCSACSSGTAAIGHAFRAIVDGKMDCALCGGAEYLGDEFGGVFRAFDSAGALVKGSSPDAYSPFDKDRNGFLFAQGGAGILFIEEEKHALERNAPILAELRGYAENFDPFSSMSMEPEGRRIEEMIQEALESSSLKPAQINYINAHGTGTIANDEIESAVIERIFGQHPWVNSSKSIVGHTLGACGGIEAGITVLSLHQKKIHPCKNLKKPVRALRFPSKAIETDLQYALSQSFAFGGHNAVLALNRYQQGTNYDS